MLPSPSIQRLYVLVDRRNPSDHHDRGRIARRFEPAPGPCISTSMHAHFRRMAAIALGVRCPTRGFFNLACPYFGFASVLVISTCIFSQPPFHARPPRAPAGTKLRLSERGSRHRPLQRAFNGLKFRAVASSVDAGTGNGSACALEISIESRAHRGNRRPAPMVSGLEMRIIPRQFFHPRAPRPYRVQRCP